MENIMILTIQVVCAILTLYLGPTIVTQLIRSVVHNLGYILSRFDLFFAVSVVGMVIFGIPKL